MAPAVDNSPARPAWMAPLVVASMLLAGSCTPLLAKYQLSTNSVGSNASLEPFHQAWFLTLQLAVGMSLVGLVELLRQLPSRWALRKRSAESGVSTPSHDQCDTGDPTPGPSFGRKVLYVGVPAAFDMLSTGLTFWGLTFIPPSIFQMLRGSCLVFTALFSIVILKRRIRLFHWAGIGVVTVSLALVGLSQILKDDSQHSQQMMQTLFAIGIVLVGQVLLALQVVIEELLLKELHLPPLQLVGLEGLWGIGLVCLVFLPGMDVVHGWRLDAMWGTLTLLLRSRELVGLSVSIVLCCAVLNASAMMITGMMSGVHRQLLDPIRTCIIWAFGLVVNYGISSSSVFAGPWSRFSWLQLLGFLLLVLGQLIYTERIKLPCVKSQCREEDGAAVSPKSCTSKSTTSTSSECGTGISASPSKASTRTWFGERVRKDVESAPDLEVGA